MNISFADECWTACRLSQNFQQTLESHLLEVGAGPKETENSSKALERSGKPIWPCSNA